MPVTAAPGSTAAPLASCVSFSTEGDCAGAPKTLKCQWKTGQDCNGKIQLVNPTPTDPADNAKVAALAHGQFGDMADWRVLNGCSTHHYGKLDKSIFASRIGKLNHLLHNCGRTPATQLMCRGGGGSPEQVGKFYDASGSPKPTGNFTTAAPDTTGDCVCVLKQKVFTDAGVDFPEQSANGGVVLSWGHGVKDGACGSVTYLRQGPGSKSNPNPNPDYTTINFQIGTRSWSGEWSDSLSGPQIYLTHGLEHESDSTTCLQPLMQPIPDDVAGCSYDYTKPTAAKCDVDKLLEKACEGANCPAVPDIPSTASCPNDSNDCSHVTPKCGNCNVKNIIKLGGEDGVWCCKHPSGVPTNKVCQTCTAGSSGKCYNQSDKSCNDGTNGKCAPGFLACGKDGKPIVGPPSTGPPSGGYSCDWTKHPPKCKQQSWAQAPLAACQLTCGKETQFRK